VRVQLPLQQEERGGSSSPFLMVHSPLPGPPATAIRHNALADKGSVLGGVGPSSLDLPSGQQPLPVLSHSLSAASLSAAAGGPPSSPTSRFTPHTSTHSLHSAPTLQHSEVKGSESVPLPLLPRSPSPAPAVSSGGALSGMGQGRHVLNQGARSVRALSDDTRLRGSLSSGGWSVPHHLGTDVMSQQAKSAGGAAGLYNGWSNNDGATAPAVAPESPELAAVRAAVRDEAPSMEGVLHRLHLRFAGGKATGLSGLQRASRSLDVQSAGVMATLAAEVSGQHGPTLTSVAPHSPSRTMSGPISPFIMMTAPSSVPQESLPHVQHDPGAGDRGSQGVGPAAAHSNTTPPSVSHIAGAPLRMSASSGSIHARRTLAPKPLVPISAPASPLPTRPSRAPSRQGAHNEQGPHQGPDQQPLITCSNSISAGGMSDPAHVPLQSSNSAQPDILSKARSHNALLTASSSAMLSMHPSDADGGFVINGDSAGISTAPATPKGLRLPASRRPRNLAHVALDDPDSTAVE
jgi:hypothetical protein